MKPEVSLLCSQQPATLLCPCQPYPVHLFPFYSSQKHFNIILLSTLKMFTPISNTNPLHTALHSPIRAICPAHLIFLKIDGPFHAPRHVIIYSAAIFKRKRLARSYANSTVIVCTLLHSKVPLETPNCYSSCSGVRIIHSAVSSCCTR